MPVDDQGRNHQPAGAPASAGGRYAPQQTPDAAVELTASHEDAVEALAVLIDDDANLDPDVEDGRSVSPHRAAAAVAARYPGHVDAGELAQQWVDDPNLWRPSTFDDDYVLDVHSAAEDVQSRLADRAASDAVDGMSIAIRRHFPDAAAVGLWAEPGGDIDTASVAVIGSDGTRQELQLHFDGLRPSGVDDELSDAVERVAAGFAPGDSRFRPSTPGTHDTIIVPVVPDASTFRSNR